MEEMEFFHNQYLNLIQEIKTAKKEELFPGEWYDSLRRQLAMTIDTATRAS